MATSINGYAELRCRTCFSFLRGASHPEELIRRAAQLGLEGIGIVDRNGVYGIPKAYQALKGVKTEHPELKLLVGAELMLTGGGSVSFLVEDRRAYGLLCRMITAAFFTRDPELSSGSTDARKGEAALGFEQLTHDWLSRPEARGLICVVAPEELEVEFAADLAAPEKLTKTGQDAGASRQRLEARLGALRECLGGERLLLALARLRDGRDRERTLRARELERRYGIPLVASNDVHCHVRARQKLQDVLTSIRSGKPLSEAGFRLFQNAERHLKSPRQMATLFRDLPEAVARTTRVARRCNFCPSELRYRYPSEWIPAGHSAQSYLEELTWKGARERYGERLSDAVLAQLRHELGLIAQLSFADYFLTIYEIVDFARSRSILCQGRGSAANSVVCYCLGITAVDPVRMNLLFERFLSAERGEPPDIDVDFEHERREEVIQHIYEKYGRDRAAMVSAVVTYQRRSAFREISKALGVEVGTLSAKEVQKRFPELSARSGVPECEQVVGELVAEMEGMPRHLSIHSGGFTLSADPIIEIVPVEPARMDGRTIIQWDKYDLDYLGLLKVDVLSLGMLSALRKTLDEVGLKLHEVPAEDPETYAMIQRADTVGTFQIESRAQMSMLGRLLPRTFYDLVIQVAIVRPGPIVGKMVHPYLRRRRGQEPVTLPDPRLREILGRTLGVPLFQEQVMKLAISLAGFTPGEADELRRAIGAWRSTGSIEKMGLRLMEGLTRSGLPPAFARQTFEQIQGFSAYGFPESHAASFALIAYVSAYLKRHHPAEFTCALLNSQPMGFYSNHTLVEDARRHGVEILPVDPRFSEWDCRVERRDRASPTCPPVGGPPACNGVPAERGFRESSERKRAEGEKCKDGALRLGLRIVHGLARADADRWIAERQARPFEGLMDFAFRTQLRLDTLRRLALSGAFECFGWDQRHALWRLLEWQLLREPREAAQLSFFEHWEARDSVASGLFQPLSPMQALREEYEAYGLSSRMHPMLLLRKQLRLPGLTTGQARAAPHGRRIVASGMVIVRQRPPTAKGVGFATLEDECGFLDLILHADVFEKHREAYLEHSFLTVGGFLQKDTHTVSLIVRDVKAIAIDWVVEGSTYFNTMSNTTRSPSRPADQRVK